MISDFELIEKENIQLLQFPRTDVLNTKEAIFQRVSDLNRALLLGNIEHSKTKIFFEDSQSKKMVETTIWGVTDKMIILKKGSSIPINRIYKSL